jgi:hypothetical protein
MRVEDTLASNQIQNNKIYIKQLTAGEEIRRKIY